MSVSTAELQTNAVKPGIGPLRLALPPIVVMALAAAPVGFIGASLFETDHYGGFGDVGEAAKFFVDLSPLIALAVVISLGGVVALARACFRPGQRAAPVILGLGASYLLGLAAALGSTVPRDPLSTIVFILLGLALVAPSLAFLRHARKGPVVRSTA